MDALPVLVCYVVLLMGIPSQLILRPLGAAGTPAQIVAVGLLAWWLLSRIVAQPVERVSNPVKTLLTLFALSILVSYIAGMIRPIAFLEEVNSSDRAILSLCAWCGVALVVTDGLPTRASLDKLLRTVAGGATVIAVLGLLQFFFKVDLAHYVHIPGLSPNGQFGALLARSSFQRVSGTTSHPIEFGAVLSCALPLLIHFARFADTRRSRRNWWIATALVGAVLPMSVARSAILGATVAVLYLFHTWPSRLKLRMLIAGAAGLVVMSFAVPGLLGTIKGLFLNGGDDPSTAGRTADYAPVIRYTSERPLFGRGIGTFIPNLYRTLDNQYLGIVVEAGLVGLIATLVLLLGTICVAGSVRRNTRDESTRDLAQCLKAGIAVLAVNSAFFDSFGFPMAVGMLFILLGAAGALWATENVGRIRPVYTRAQRRTAMTSAVLAVATVAGAGLLAVRGAKPEYQAYATVLLTSPNANLPVYATSGRADLAASLLHDIFETDQLHDTLRANGVHDYEVALGDASLMPGTDVVGTGGPTLRFVTKASSATEADSAMAATIDETRTEMVTLQTNAAIPDTEQIKVDVLQKLAAVPVSGRPARAEAMLVVVLLMLVITLRRGIRRRMGRLGRQSAPASTAELSAAPR